MESVEKQAEKKMGQFIIKLSDLQTIHHLVFFFHLLCGKRHSLDSVIFPIGDLSSGDLL